MADVGRNMWCDVNNLLNKFQRDVARKTVESVPWMMW
jgi:hypothetical protein